MRACLDAGVALAGAQVLLVFANKQDLPNAMNASDLTVPPTPMSHTLPVNTPQASVEPKATAA